MIVDYEAGAFLDSANDRPLHQESGHGLDDATIIASMV